MIRKALVTAAAGIAIIAASSLASSRANAMPNGLPAAAIDQIDITEPLRSASTSTAGTDPACINADIVCAAALAGTVIAAAGVSWSVVAAAGAP
jgi:hypothetical protein